MIQCARQCGVELMCRSPVSAWGASATGVWVSTAEGRYEADALIVTAGAWSARMLQQLNLPLAIQRKVQFWIEVKEPGLYAPERFPIFITDSEFGQIYGFPLYKLPGLKIADHAGGDPTDPEKVNRTVAADEIHDVMRLASWFLEGVTSNVLQSAVCLYARTPDGDFILDRHPEWPNVVIGAGFSGHGFKFAPAIGEHLVSLALDGSVPPYQLFRLNRFPR
jgi:sarcosine oxidase